MDQALYPAVIRAGAPIASHVPPKQSGDPACALRISRLVLQKELDACAEEISIGPRLRTRCWNGIPGQENDKVASARMPFPRRPNLSANIQRPLGRRPPAEFDRACRM